MGWLRVDDGFAQHPKILALTPRDRWTWLEILCYCARYRTEGDIPEGIADSVKTATKSVLDRLINSGLIDIGDDGDDGLMSVHDWADYNPKDPANADRQARFRERRRYGRNAPTVTGRNGEAVTPAVTKPLRVTAPRALAGARDPSPISSKAGLTTEASSAALAGLPIEKQTKAQALLAWAGTHCDNGTATVLAKYAHQLPEAALARVLESTTTATPDNRAGYVIGALVDELQTLGEP